MDTYSAPIWGRSAMPYPEGRPAAHSLTKGQPKAPHVTLCNLSNGSIWWVDTETGELLADATPKITRQLRRSALSNALGQALAPGSEMTIEGDQVLFNGVPVDFQPGEGKQERYRVLHHLTARHENQYIALAKRGKGYVCLGGAAFHTPSRWDAHTMAHKSHQTRKRARTALRQTRAALPMKIRKESTRLLQGRPCRRGAVGFSLVTLSVPRAASYVSLPDKVKAINAAWALLRKRKIWDSVLGSIKGVEVVIHSWDEEADPYHVHIHLLVLAPFIDREALAKAWADCLDVDKAIVDIRRVRYNARGDGDCSVEGALLEVTKYITKGSDLAHRDADGNLLALPEEQLLELEGIARWPRQFEVLGLFHGRDKEPSSPVAAEGGHTSLDTTSLSVGAQEGEKEEPPKIRTNPTGETVRIPLRKEPAPPPCASSWTPFPSKPGAGRPWRGPTAPEGFWWID